MRAPPPRAAPPVPGSDDSLYLGPVLLSRFQPRAGEPTGSKRVIVASLGDARRGSLSLFAPRVIAPTPVLCVCVCERACLRRWARAAARLPAETAARRRKAARAGAPATLSRGGRRIAGVARGQRACGRRPFSLDRSTGASRRCQLFSGGISSSLSLPAPTPTPAHSERRVRLCSSVGSAPPSALRPSFLPVRP